VAGHGIPGPVREPRRTPGDHMTAMQALGYYSHARNARDKRSASLAASRRLAPVTDFGAWLRTSACDRSCCTMSAADEPTSSSSPRPHSRQAAGLTAIRVPSSEAITAATGNLSNKTRTRSSPGETIRTYHHSPLGPTPNDTESRCLRPSGRPPLRPRQPGGNETLLVRVGAVAGLPDGEGLVGHDDPVPARHAVSVMPGCRGGRAGAARGRRGCPGSTLPGDPRRRPFHRGEVRIEAGLSSSAVRRSSSGVSDGVSFATHTTVRILGTAWRHAARASRPPQTTSCRAGWS
jgi:hypothetical protein